KAPESPAGPPTEGQTLKAPDSPADSAPEGQAAKAPESPAGPPTEGQTLNSPYNPADSAPENQAVKTADSTPESHAGPPTEGQAAKAEKPLPLTKKELRAQKRELLELANAPPKPDAETCKWFLASLILLSLPRVRNENADKCFPLLDVVPDAPELAPLLASALAAVSVWILIGGGKTEDADRHLSRMFNLPRFGSLKDSRQHFAACIVRALRRAPVNYGPGAGLPGREGAVANMNSLIPRLPQPEDACYCTWFLSAFSFLFDPKPADLEEMARGFQRWGQPNVPLFKLGWEAFAARVAFDAKAPGASSAALGRVEALSSSGGFKLLSSDRRSRGISPVSQVASDFGASLSRMAPGDAKRAVAALAPPLARGEISRPAFAALVRPFSLSSPLEFQEAVMDAVEEGLFGDGLPELQAVVMAGLLPSRSAKRIARYESACAALRVRATSTSSTSSSSSGGGGGTNAAGLCLGFIDAELAARSTGDPRKAFAALATLRPASGYEDGAFAWAYAAALVAASWGPAGRRPSPMGRALPGPDPLLLDLLRLLPSEAVLETPALGEIMRDAACFSACAAMNPGTGLVPHDGLSDAGAFAAACLSAASGLPPCPEILEAGALRVGLALCEAPPADREALKPAIRLAYLCLSGELPLALRNKLKHACGLALAHLGLDDEMAGWQELFGPVLLHRSADKSGDLVGDSVDARGDLPRQPSFMLPPQIGVRPGVMFSRMTEGELANDGLVKALAMTLGRPPEEADGEALDGSATPAPEEADGGTEDAPGRKAHADDTGEAAGGQQSTACGTDGGQKAPACGKEGAESCHQAPAVGSDGAAGGQKDPAVGSDGAAGGQKDTASKKDGAESGQQAPAVRSDGG
ncbi:MAG: hypothetical protein LBQ12_12660, partial [Deltaproteobacteria bacterium]|nr:hypothetical protein [Deltaproteobacteria bacterium]